MRVLRDRAFVVGLLWPCGCQGSDAARKHVEVESSPSRPVEVWSSDKILSEVRQRVSKNLEAEARTSFELGRVVDFDAAIGSFREIAGDHDQHKLPACRFFETSGVIHQTIERKDRGLRARSKHVRVVVGLKEGSSQWSDVHNIDLLLQFVMKEKVEIGDDLAFAAVIERCCFGGDGSEELMTRVTREGSRMLISRGSVSRVVELDNYSRIVRL